MFIAALSTTTKTRKQPTCPSAEEWMEKTWRTYTMDHYSATEGKKWCIRSNMAELVMTTPREGCQTETSLTWRHLCAEWEETSKRTYLPDRRRLMDLKTNKHTCGY